MISLSLMMRLISSIIRELTHTEKLLALHDQRLGADEI